MPRGLGRFPCWRRTVRAATRGPHRQQSPAPETGVVKSEVDGLASTHVVRQEIAVDKAKQKRFGLAQAKRLNAPPSSARWGSASCESALDLAKPLECCVPSCIRSGQDWFVA